MDDTLNKFSNGEIYKLSRKRLSASEYEMYKRIGKIDFGQRGKWLELFTPTIISDLFAIMNSGVDKVQKARYIMDEMGYYGFEDVGLGTNVYTAANPAYPGVVYKFALDPDGQADNFNDPLLMQMVNGYLGRPRYNQVLDWHPSHIVSVQARKLPMTPERMEGFLKSITKTLEKLMERFLIIDLSPVLYTLNYGIERNGDWCFIDASDLYPLANVKSKISCHKAVGYDEKKRETKYCHGQLRYAPDFSAVVCTRCGAEYMPIELRPKEKEGKKIMSKALANVMSDGMTADEREVMRLREIDAVRRNPRSAYNLQMASPAPAKKPRFRTAVESTPEPEPAEETPAESIGSGALPTTHTPRVTFVPPRATPTIIHSESDEEDDVEMSGLPEPDEDTRSRMSTSFDDAAEEDLPDFPEEDEEAVGADDDEDADPKVIQAADEPDEEARLEYSITDGDESAININIIGDPEEAMANDLKPIFISLNDGIWTQAIGAKALRGVLSKIIQDLQDEQNE